MNTLLYQIAQKNPFRDFRVLNRQQLEVLVQLLSLQFLQAIKQCNPFWINKKNIEILSVCSYRATNAFYSESTLYNCLIVMELPARNRCDI